MKALVTGAPGFIGSHLVEALLNKGYSVTCLIRDTSHLRWTEHLDISYIRGELADPSSYRNDLTEYDFVFHVAGVTKAVREKDFFIGNAENTKQLLRAIADTRSHIKRFVFLSSQAAVGPSHNGVPVNESSPPQPVSAYGRSKLEGEKHVLSFQHVIPFSIIRPPAVYGPRDTDFLLFFKTIKKGFYPYWGKCHYSLLYVEDLIKGIILSSETQRAENQIFFLSGSINYTNDEIAKEISSALGKKARKVSLPRACMPLVGLIGEKLNQKSIMNRDRVKDFRYSNWTCDAGKAKDEIGFETTISLPEGIKWTADWYKIHKWL
jgi:nucleoside-diphosphate-sugar epimerase